MIMMRIWVPKIMIIALLALILFPLFFSPCEARANDDYEIFYIRGMNLYETKSDASGETLVDGRKLSRLLYHFSPDQNYIAYHIREEAGEILCLRDLKEKKVYELVEFSGNPRHIIWSPDSKLLALSISRHDNAENAIVLFDGSGRKVKELKGEGDYQKIHWDDIWWRPDQSGFYIEATFTVNPNRLDKRYISKDIATGKETVLGETPDYFHNMDATIGDLEKYFPDRYQQPDFKVPNPQITTKLGNVYLGSRRITPFKEYHFSGMYQGFFYITTLPDNKILLFGPCPDLLNVSDIGRLSIVMDKLMRSGRELYDIYVYDPGTNRLNIVAEGSSPTARTIE